MIAFFRSVFLTRRWYITLSTLAAFFVISHFLPALLLATQLAFYAFMLATLVEVSLLYRRKNGLIGVRELPERFSNGDENPVTIRVQSGYEFNVFIEVIDEVPPQFQLRNARFKQQLNPNQQATISYSLRPTERGDYNFGHVNVLVSSALGLVQRLYKTAKPTNVPVYPSFLQMQSFEIMAASNRLHQIGVKKIRRIGQATEFERIKEYVVGDDPRTVNWRATARRGELMVNQYQDERAQPLYCVIDAGRVMEMPFEGLSLLDYSINASLVIGNVALKKHDKVGMIQFSHQVEPVLKATGGIKQLGQLMRRLYALKTGFLETDYERLYSAIRHNVKQRSLLLLFTNFESMSALKRQLPYLKALARIHLLVVIFFENTELTSVASIPSDSVEAVYIRTIASQFMLQKQEIVMELRKHGIQSVLTPPEQLSVNTLNKYLELKARGLF